MAQQVQDLERRLSLDGPLTDDELWNWVRINLDMEIPRNSVCDGHAAPFTFLADLYFERTKSAVAMANRGGSKTHTVAILHLLNMKFKPGIECMTVGAIESQAQRAYQHFNYLMGTIRDKGFDDAQVVKKEQALFKNGSQLDLAAGTMNAVNGPHPQVVHVDEVELMDPDVYQESRNMSQAKKKKGKIYHAQDIITSTRKRGVGPMQEIVDSINEAKLQGFEPPYELYTWCVFETAENMPNCQIAKPELKDQYDNEGECLACDCHKIQGGRWDSGEPRVLKDVCGGRFAKSDGWIPHETIKNTFTKSARRVWEAQQECIRPSTEGLVMPQFSVERHGIRLYEPDMDNGPIFMSIDFGGTNPHAVSWYQLLRYDIDVRTASGIQRRLREGTRVCFDEIYRAEVSNTQIATAIAQKEEIWKQKVSGFRVHRRFADPQGKAARLDLARHRPPIPTEFITTRDVKEHIKICSYLIENDLFVVDVDRCENFVAEIESWHYPKKKAGMQDDPEKPVEDFDHCMSNWRYAMANIDKIISGGSGKAKPPKAGPRQHVTVKGSGTRRPKNELPAWAPWNNGLPKTERWRSNFGNITE